MTEPHFIGQVEVVWPEKEPRIMRLINVIHFIDSNGTKWSAYDGSEINGANIPRIMWPIIGSPFVGLYRRPSVFHDVHCVLRIATWQKVHKMFYEAMLADSVSKKDAQIMYAAVLEFGPKWDSNGKDITALDIGNQDPDFDHL